MGLQVVQRVTRNYSGLQVVKRGYNWIEQVRGG